jgi:site-specific recombinase XerD
MYLYDVEAFIGACARKGLAAKTLASYEQTLRMFGMLLKKRGIDRTEQIKHTDIESYMKCG